MYFRCGLIDSPTCPTSISTHLLVLTTDASSTTVVFGVITVSMQLSRQKILGCLEPES